MAIITQNYNNVITDFLTTYLECDLTAVQLFLSKRKRSEQKLCQKLYGLNYDQKQDRSHLESSETLTYTNILKKLKQEISLFNLSLWERLGCTKEELLAVVRTIDLKTSQYRQVLNKVWGKDLSQIPDLSGLNPTEERSYDNALRFLQNTIKAKPILETESGQSLQETLGCTEEEAILFINQVLAIKPEVKKVFMLVFGFNLDQKGSPKVLNNQELEIFNKWCNPDFRASQISKPKIVKSKKQDSKKKRGKKQTIIKKPRLNKRPSVALNTSVTRDRYLWEIIGCSKEDFATLIGTLNPQAKYYAALVQVHGPNLDERRHWHSDVDKNDYNSGKKTLKRNYESMFTNHQTLKTYLNGSIYLNEVVGCSYEELINILNSESIHQDSEYFRSLQKACGQDFKSPIKTETLDKKEQANYRFGVKLLTRIYQAMDKTQIMSKKMYLYNKIGCSKEELQLLLTSPLIGKESKYYQALQLGFGTSLEDPLNEKRIPKEYKDAFYDGIYHLKNLYQRVFITKTLQLSGQSNLKSATYLAEAIGCSYHELMNLVKHPLFAKDTKYFSALQKACGPLFDQKINLEALTYLERKDFNYGVERLSQLYLALYQQKNIINVHTKKNGPYLIDIVGCSYDELMTIVARREFNQNSLYYQALQKACGSNLDEAIDLSGLTSLEVSNYHTGIKRLKAIAKNPKNAPILLTDYLDCDSSDLEKVMPLFAYEFASYYEFLINLTGPNLNQSFVYYDLTRSERQQLHNIKDILNRRIANLDKNTQTQILEGRYLNEIIGCSYEELLKIISLWNKEDYNYQLLTTIFGANFDKPYANHGLSIKHVYYVNQALMQLTKDFIFQRDINDDIELLLPTANEVQESFVIKLIVYLPAKYQKLIMAYFKGQMPQIAQECQMSLERAYACSQIILEWFTKMNAVYNQKETSPAEIDFRKVQQYLLRTKD